MGEKTEYDKLFIGGRWTEPSTSEVIEVHCPATGEYVGKVPLAAAADVDAAVAAARAAFDNGPWPSTPPKERATVIANALKLLEERKDHFAKLLADETGQPPMTVETMHWMGSIGALNFFAGPPWTRSGGKRSATGPTGRPSSTGSRSVWWARSWPGTCPCSWRSTSWVRRRWRAARWCSNPLPKHR
ncbi:aldehyde dehydrogenase family protein [Mycobacterium ulcerans str. Harvey]|uniref:Aldehyde dehydrogenase family protein n=1 Tax=Mycobacterium ulcerans str. Harvey TaxID=1299332 RepID=A0ABP3AKC6_MYCUL|nr:aldehyde dehydrogenase family protein [Mycobacterium ulcerans str. Harvey]